VPKPTIIITGANGFVGSALVSYYADQGWHVRAAVRDPSKFANTTLVTYMPYDITKKPSSKLFLGANYLVHAAYIKQSRHTPNASDLNLKGSEALALVAHQNNIATIFMSTMSAHEGALSSYGKHKVAAEQFFNGKHDSIIRAGLIIGQGGLAKSMVHFMKTKRVVPLINGGNQPLQTIAIDDLLGATHAIFVRKLHGTFIVAEPKSHTYKTFYQMIAKKLRIKVLFVPVPVVVPMAVIATIHALHIPFAITKDNLLGLTQLRAIDTASDLGRLGIKVKTFAQTLRSLEVDKL
jgi:nucleoside-diphosphate-sugar epimerase